MSSTKQKILLIEDSKANRDALKECLIDEFDIIEAENGALAVPILKKSHKSISLIFLDLVMPEMDGFGVLTYLKTNNLLDDIPVIAIANEKDQKRVYNAFKCGAQDFVTKPFDKEIIKKRVQNILDLFAKQKKLIKIVSDEYFERTKNTNMLIDILGHTVEFRNGENGYHIMHMNIITEILLNRLVAKTDKYNLTTKDIDLISSASALHDLGKVGIKESILNKPGKLTKEEQEIMKGHTKIGANIIQQLIQFKNEKIYQYAYEIARWHHERYDGKGYPDGLKGDNIPISAQVVGLAECYDVLVNDRAYKKTYTHDQAMKMILNGECGAFNPLLLKCIKEGQHEIKDGLDYFSKINRDKQKIDVISTNLFKDQKKSADVSYESEDSLDTERIRMFYSSKIFDEIIFDYTVATSVLNFNDSGREILKVDGVIYEPVENRDFVEVFGRNNIDRFVSKLKKTTYNNPNFEMSLKLLTGDKITKYNLVCSSMWHKFNHDEMIGFVGRAYKSR